MSSETLTVAAPSIIDREVVKPLMCGPGPCDVWPSVNKALVQPVISPMCDEYFNVIDDIRKGLQYAFQTESKLILALSGSGHTGMEAVISNLLRPGETLLIASRGIWDERAFVMAKRYGLKTAITRTPSNSTFSEQQLDTVLKRLRPVALFITHGDSSTGTLQDVSWLGALCHKYGVLLLVDTVVSLCAVPFFMDAWGVDAVYTSTQKALSGPAGISAVAFSRKAELRIQNRKHEPPFYFDIKILAQQWNCYGNTRLYHHTLSPPLLWALRACLREVCQETLPSSWKRHESATKLFHERLNELSLQFYVPVQADRLATVTTIILPKGYDYMEFVQYMREKHDILIFGGLGPTAGKALRIGIMGVNATEEIANRVAAAMADTLQALRRAKL